MDKKDILLSKFIGCQNGFCLTTKSANENDIYFVSDMGGSQAVIQNYNNLSTDAFEVYLNNINISTYRIGTRVNELQNISSEDDYNRFLDRVFSNARQTKLKFKDIVDKIYIKYNLEQQIDTLKNQLKNLEKYKVTVSEPNVFYTSQKLQAIALLKSLDVKGRTDAQKLSLIKESLSRMEYTIPTYNDVESFEEELIEPVNRTNIVSSEEIVEEEPVTSGIASQIINSSYEYATQPITFRTTSGTARDQIDATARAEYERLFGGNVASIEPPTYSGDYDAANDVDLENI